MMKSIGFAFHKLIYLCVIILLFSKIVTGSFLNIWKKTNKDVINKWAPDLFGTVDTNAPKIINKEMYDILTNPTKNYIRAVLKSNDSYSALILDIILAYVGKNSFSSPLVIDGFLDNFDNISFSPDYGYMVTWSSKSIKVWLLQRCLCVRQFKQKKDMLKNSIRIASNGEFIISSSKTTIKIWYPREKKPYELSCGLEANHALAISSDNILIGTITNSDSNRYVKVWEINNRQFTLKWFKKSTYEQEFMFGPACEFFHENTLFCAGQIHNMIIIFTASNGKAIKTIKAHNPSPRPLTFFIFMPEINRIFIGSKQKVLHCLDLNTKAEIQLKYVGRSFDTNINSVDIDVSESAIAICNTVEFIFLLMIERTEFKLLSYNLHTNVCILSPSGKYCAIYDYIIKEIKIVSVNDLIYTYNDTF